MFDILTGHGACLLGVHSGGLVYGEWVDGCRRQGHGTNKASDGFLLAFPSGGWPGFFSPPPQHPTARPGSELLTILFSLLPLAAILHQIATKPTNLQTKSNCCICHDVLQEPMDLCVCLCPCTYRPVCAHVPVYSCAPRCPYPRTRTMYPAPCTRTMYPYHVLVPCTRTMYPYPISSRFSEISSRFSEISS